MSTSFDSRLPSWEDQENQYQQQLNSQNWKVTKKVLNWLLIIAVIVLGIWVLILKFSYEPGVHVQLINQSGSPLKDIRLIFSWCEYSQKILPVEPRESWRKPYGVSLQRTGVIEENAKDLTITWTDNKGINHRHVARDLYLTTSSVLVIITFQTDGTVTVKDHIQGWG